MSSFKSKEPDNVKEYNKSYYERNKKKIIESMMIKEHCPMCNKLVSHQQINKHMKSKLCMRKRQTTLKHRLITLKQETDNKTIKLNIDNLLKCM